MLPPSRTIGPILIALWAGFAGCAIHQRSASVNPPPIVVDAAQTGATDRMQAIAQLEDYLKATPTAEVMPWVMAWAGEQRRLSGDDDRARQWWETVGSTYPGHFVSSTASLGIAVLNSREDPRGNVLATLQLIEPKGQPDTLNADRYRLLARVAQQDGASTAEVEDLAEKAMEYAKGDPTVYSRVARMLEDLIPEEVEPLATGQDPEKLALDAIHAALRDKRFDAVISQGETFLSTWPESEHAPRAGYLVKRAQAGDPAEAGKVTVLLPLSGRYAKLGENLKAVIELANTDMQSPLDLEFVDTMAAQVAWEASQIPAEEEDEEAEAGEEADGAEEAVVPAEEFDPIEEIQALTERAVLETGSIAILGPLLKEHAVPAAEAAQALGVPMLSLSRTYNPTESGDFVFRGQLPDSQQVQAIVQHAVEDRGLTQLALLHPGNSYGAQMKALFEEAAEEAGATLVRVVAYDTEATDFRTVAQELGQKDYELRKDEFKEMVKAAERANMNSDKLVLPPIIDFEAIFIADNWKRAAMISNGLAYEEFPIGEFLPNKHIPTLPLLGLNSWHDTRIIELGGVYIQHATFVDAFSATHSGAAAEEWVRYYQETFNGQTPKVFHAVTWDTTRLLAAAVLAGGPDREHVRDALAQAEIVDPIGAGSHFNEDREVDRTLLLLSVEGEEIVPWAPPVDENETGEAIAP